MNKYSIIALLAWMFSTMTIAQDTTLKVATFNVSMEALNYVEHKRGESPNVSGKTLSQALASDHQQIKNIAEIIQKVNPDIILLNEFDNQNNDSQQGKNQALKTFINHYLNKSQNGQRAIDFPYFYQGPVNTGVNSGLDIDGNGKKGVLPGDGYGFGYFPGHFGMALLSKYPINVEKIRSFQHFKWHDMPNALKPKDPETNKPWYSQDVWQELRLSSKSHWDVPVEVNGKTLHILASHPTPPVFDGPEDRNGKRNHDEIRFWHDYISPDKASYIYDDKGNKGGIKAKQAFVILGDLNASTVDGDAVKAGISSLIHNKQIQDAMPQSQGGKTHTPDNSNAKHHTAFWRMRADYVLPSVTGLTLNDSGIFWPSETDDSYRLIKDRKASSDHRLVWLELTTKN
ncbi:endonuclease/exonuclease/phosphatase family protein [Colwellia sp. 12G3]|uniref:endonuclease/exonuclease/phosphatase family protein n=1 Tax=Colwellia sp. 12G3 TaxID=2058299 RepID=UPI000C32227F|nr:endonuclease/exonuclease/phosphatase family protein [Colwellia sp. 12G3]PKI16748.1 endonuclease/exonuclease/phosphatase family protein [Colwellia sp. 12G3]